MRLLKWLFQPAYLLLLIVLAALYVNREVIFSREVAESLEAEALVAQVDGLVDQLQQAPELVTAAIDASAEDSSAESSPVEVEVAPVVAEATPVEVEAAPVAVEAAPVEVELTPVAVEAAPVEVEAAPVEVEAAPVAVEATAVEVEATAVEVEAAPVVAEADPMAVEAAPVEVTSNPMVAEEPSAPAQPPMQLWRAARAAVWQGDLDGAVAHYRRLISAQPDNYDAYGEMGNVLLAQQNVAAAIEAYVSAAELIDRAGHTRMARHLAGVVIYLDEAQGRALVNRLSR